MDQKDAGRADGLAVLHVDMDAFFASVEALDDPSLAGRPLIVGGAGPRGVVASCSYEARVFGVRSAMPSSRARSLCPGAVFVSGRYDRYSEVSRQMHAVFRRFTPLVEGISLDEAFLDVTGSVRLFGPAPAIAAAIRAQILGELNLRCSVGVAPVKFLAKLASEAAKPRAGPGGYRDGAGVVVVRPGEELAFLHPLPVEALWGVGAATAERLHRLGLTTVGELARVPAEVLEAAVGRAHGAHLARLARGIDTRPVEPERETKSVSHEETYPADRFEREELRVEVLRMSDAVATRMKRAALVGRTVTLKVRYGDFSTLTRSVTVSQGLDSGPRIAALATDLLASVDIEAGVRLLGVGISNLGPAAALTVEQLALDLIVPDQPRAPGSRAASPDSAGPGPPAASSVWDGPGGSAASEAVEAVRRRFGDRSVGPAALVGPGGLRLKRAGDTQWGPARVARQEREPPDQRARVAVGWDEREDCRGGSEMPLNENEERILAEIERQFHAQDPESAKRISSTTLQRYLARNCRWAAVGFVVGLVILLAAFASNWVLGVCGFLIMVASAVVLIQNLRRMSRLGLEQVSRSLGGRNLSEMADDLARRLRRRFRGPSGES